MLPRCARIVFIGFFATFYVDVWSRKEHSDAWRMQKCVCKSVIFDEYDSNYDDDDNSSFKNYLKWIAFF